MSDFRTKFFGLAVVATAFAGMSYGQVSCVGGTQTTNVSPILDRAEGETELVSDVVLNCPNSAVVANGQLTVFASLPVTSKAITPTPNNGLNGNTEAVLQILNTGAPVGTPPAIYTGTVTGSIITFTGVSFPAAFQATISNVRVNASTAGAGTTPIPVTESVFAGTNGSATLVFNNVVVGYVLKSLTAPAFLTNNLGFPAVTNFNVCNGNPVSGLPGVAPGGPAFTVIVSEAFGGAFKMQVDPMGVITNQEQGSFVPGGGLAIGTASSGTEISLTFGNVPASATLYVPATIVSGSLTLTLTGNPTVATTPAGLTFSGGGPSILAPSGPVAFTPTSGTVTATYQVTQSSAANLESANVPVYVTFAGNSAAAQGPITVLESYAPTGTLTGPATSVPVFAPSTATPLNASIISVCQTTLLFPFVTNAAGFETGIAIANTTTDNLGAVTTAAPGGRSLATPTNGTCVLNFYGASTQPTAFTTPVIGVNTTTVPTQGPVYANTLSTMSGAANLTGYVIAQCNFLEAHGFSYIVDNFGTPSGTAEGYLAIVIPNGRGEVGGNGN